MTVQFNLPASYAITANGEMIPGSRLYFYQAGTEDTVDVYSDSDLTTPIAQPVEADAAGRFPRIFLDAGLYKIAWKDASDSLINQWDDYDPGLSSALGTGSALPINQGGTGATSAAAALNALGAASQSQATSIANLVSTLSAQVATGLNDDDEFGALASKDNISTAELASGFGAVCLQRVRSTTLSNTSVNASIPNDTSIPQSNEGVQVFSQSFTPVSDSSTIKINVHLTGDPSTTGIFIAAFFQDSNVDAIAADEQGIAASSTPLLNFGHEIENDSTTARTYKVRAGVSSGTVTLNSSSATLGGLRKCYLEIEEWLTI